LKDNFSFIKIITGRSNKLQFPQKYY